MGRRVGGKLTFVARTGEDFTITHHDRADRNVSVRCRSLGLDECELHEVLVGQLAAGPAPELIGQHLRLRPHPLARILGPVVLLRQDGKAGDHDRE